MKQQNKQSSSRKKIADEILRQIGGSVILVLLFVAAAAICMVGWLSITSKKNTAYTGIPGCRQSADRISPAIYQKRGTAGC